jgi:hypothetical protein
MITFGYVSVFSSENKSSMKPAEAGCNVAPPLICTALQPTPSILIVVIRNISEFASVRFH